MKTLRHLLGLLPLSLVLGGVLTGCTTERQDRPRDLAASAPHLSLSSTRLRTKLLGSEASSFFAHLQSPAAWRLELQPESARSWVSLSQTTGEANPEGLGISVSTESNTGPERTALLIVRAAGLADTLQLVQQAQTTQPGGTTGIHILGDPTLLELPALSKGAENYFVTHYAEGRVNYSLEYDTQLRHARWVAFSFDEQSSRKAVSRSGDDAWAWDPRIPAEFSTARLFRGSGYDRGHLVASEDRVSSREANRQTFYYSNMSPQIGAGFNQSYWSKIEELVRGWGRNSKLRDVLYVVKGGTIRPDQVESYKANNALLIPKYYWVALLRQQGSSYHAIGLWVEHKKYSNSPAFRSRAISIEELQRRTGLNFFHRLPDSVEAEVERESPSSPAILSLWPGL